VNTHHLKTSATPLVALHLFDGSLNNTIPEIVNWSIIFSTGDCINLDFYITLLSQIRYLLVVILELNGVSGVQYKDVMMIDDGKYQ